MARRAGVGRQWIIAFEQGKPTLKVAEVFRTLETLGFELVVTPTTAAALDAARHGGGRGAAEKLAAGRRSTRRRRRGSCGWRRTMWRGRAEVK